MPSGTWQSLQAVICVKHITKKKSSSTRDPKCTHFHRHLMLSLMNNTYESSMGKICLSMLVHWKLSNTSCIHNITIFFSHHICKIFFFIFDCPWNRTKLLQKQKTFFYTGSTRRKVNRGRMPQHFEAGFADWNGSSRVVAWQPCICGNAPCTKDFSTPPAVKLKNHQITNKHEH